MPGHGLSGMTYGLAPPGGGPRRGKTLSWVPSMRLSARRLLWFSWPSPKPEALKLGAEHLPKPASRLLCVSGRRRKSLSELPLYALVSIPRQYTTQKTKGATKKKQLRTLSPSVSRCQCLEMPYQSAACQGIVMFAAVFRAEKESSSDSFARASSISSDACFFVNCAGALTPSLPR